MELGGAAMKKSEFGAMNTKNVKFGGYSTVLIAVVLAIVVVFNILINQLPSSWTQFDLSSNKIYSIGDKTEDVLDKLTSDVTIEVLSSKEDANKQLSNFLQKYKEGSKHIKIKYVDPSMDLQLSKKYSMLSMNSLLIKSGDKEKTVDYYDIFAQDANSYYTTGKMTTNFNGEALVTGAIVYVSSKNLPVMYAVTGHSETELGNLATNMAANQNISLKNLNLLTSSIPDDCDLLLINAPKKDYTAEEADKVISYLNNGGKVLVLESYTESELKNFESVLNTYGVKTLDGIVIESADHYYQQPIYAVPDIKKSKITESLSGSNLVLISSRALAEIGLRDVSVTELLSSSDGAFIKKVVNGSIPNIDKETGDIDGPFAYAYLVEKEVSGTDDKNTKDAKVGKLVVIGAESLLDESVNQQLNVANMEFFGNCLSYLAGGEDSMNVAIPPKDMSLNYITVNALSQIILMILTVVIIPVSVFITGLIIWLKRRKK